MGPGGGDHCLIWGQVKAEDPEDTRPQEKPLQSGCRSKRKNPNRHQVWKQTCKVAVLMILLMPWNIFVKLLTRYFLSLNYMAGRKSETMMCMSVSWSLLTGAASSFCS